MTPSSSTVRFAWAVLAATALSACATRGVAPPSFNQAALPADVQVPAGHGVAFETTAAGDITYECRAGRTASTHEWVFVGPDAGLRDRRGQRSGRYWGPPATWEFMDGSKVTGTQLAVAPAGSGNIPLQLVKAQPAPGAGQAQGLTHIQRVHTRGGVAPTAACGAGHVGARQVVSYEADYIFWKAL